MLLLKYIAKQIDRGGGLNAGSSLKNYFDMARSFLTGNNPWQDHPQKV